MELLSVRILRLAIPLLALAALLAACSPTSVGGDSGNTSVATGTGTASSSNTVCVTSSGAQARHSLGSKRDSGSLTPQDFQNAYGVTPLLKAGDTGKGQTVVVIDSYGSPTLQDDINTFDQQYNLPPITLQILSPLGTKTFDPSNQEMAGWASETSLDVEVIHSIAPGAGIVVLTSPVDEVEGTTGLPQFLQLEQYAVTHHLGNIVSQSWGASEATLGFPAGQQEIQQWTNFYKQATTKEGITFFTGSGDSGATDYADCSNIPPKVLSSKPTTSFPADEPWVTSAGATTLFNQNGTYSDTAWSGSGGGFSKFFSEPSFQTQLPSANQSELNSGRGVPDVAAAGDPNSGWPIYWLGQQTVIGGTSAASPFWAALLAIADQMAGHPLGFINPALYKLGLGSSYNQDFHDVTLGNNGVPSVGIQGYSAVAGWDPVTGWGTPNAVKLIPDLIAATAK
jgi:subtilase family serine protease